MSKLVEFKGTDEGAVNSNKEAKVYVGFPKTWPNGIYARIGDPNEPVLVVWNRNAIYLEKDGKLLDCNMDWPAGRGIVGWVRISDNPLISGLICAGSANYPDGKPEGGAL